jgi:hypothetical protein
MPPMQIQRGGRGAVPEGSNQEQGAAQRIAQ